MATVTGFTASRMLAIENNSVVDGEIQGDDLILTRHGGGTINAGNVRGPQGIQGPIGEISQAQLDAAIAAVQDQMFQTGDLKMSIDTANGPGAGWLAFNNTYVNAASTYSDLWAIVPTAWKSGNDLILPDLTGASLAALGVGNVALLGNNTVNMGSADIPRHRHGMGHDHSNSHTHTDNQTEDGGYHYHEMDHSHGAGTLSADTAGAHDHLVQPVGGFVVVHLTGSGTETMGTNSGSNLFNSQMFSTSWHSGHSHPITGNTGNSSPTNTSQVGSQHFHELYDISHTGNTGGSSSSNTDYEGNSSGFDIDVRGLRLETAVWLKT